MCVYAVACFHKSITHQVITHAINKVNCLKQVRKGKKKSFTFKKITKYTFYLFLDHHSGLGIHTWHHISKITLQFHLIRDASARFDFMIKSDGCLQGLCIPGFVVLVMKAACPTLPHQTTFASHLLK